MNDQELVALLHESLPRDFTERQIAALHTAIQTSDEVRVALLDELHLEQALATRLAPELASPEHLIALLHALDKRRRRARWRWAWMLLLGVIVLGGATNAAVEAYVRYVEPHQIASLERVPVTGSDDDESGVDETVDHAPGGTEDESGDTSDDKPDEPEGERVAAPEVPAAGDEHPKVVAVPAAHDPDWRLFDDASSRKDYDWLGRVDQIFENSSGRPFRVDEKEHVVLLSGTYRLTPPTEQGRVVRLRLDGLERLNLLFHAEDEIASVELLDYGSQLRGSIGHRRRLKSDKVAKLPAGIDSRFLRKRMLTRIDPTIDLKWSRTAPTVNGDYIGGADIAIRWTGQVIAPRDGRYRFTTTSDDGVSVVVGGRRLIHNWSDHSPTEDHGEIELAAGAHDLVVEYYQAIASAQIKLEWQGPDIDRQVIPAESLRPTADATDNDGQRGLQGLYCFGASKGKLAPIELDYLTSDSGRNLFLRGGTIDLRYQDGEILIARGDIVLLALPLTKPPTKVVMDAQCSVRLAELLVLDPLPRNAERAAEVEWLAPRDGESIAPARLTWVVDPVEKKQEAEEVKNADGSVVFRRQTGSESAVCAVTSVDVGAGVDVILELDEASPDTGVVFDHYSGRTTFVIARQSQGDVLCTDPHDAGNIDKMRKSTGGVDRRFFCRIRYGFQHVQVDVSNTGRNWRELWKHTVGPGVPIPQQVKVGVAAHYHPGTRTIRIRSIRFRRPTALENLADAALVRRVQIVLAELPDIWKSSKTQVVWDAIAERCPSDVAIAPWRMAGYVAALSAAPTPVIKTESAVWLLEAAVAANVEFDALLAAFAELPLRARLPEALSPRRSQNAIYALWNALAVREQAGGHGEHLERLLDAWYRQDHGPGAPLRNPKMVAHVGLVRLCLHEAWSRNDVESLRRIAMRYYYFERNGSGRIFRDGNNYGTYALADWMLRRARQHFPDMPLSLTPMGGYTRINHPGHDPLTIDSDHSAASTIAEFMSAVDDGRFEDACRLLTTRSLPAGIVSLDADSKLAQATLVQLRDQIDGNRELAAVLQRDYQAIGELRLRQQVDQHDYDGLESLATQFHGTRAAKHAVGLLADRDLAMGNFFSAATRYDALVQDPDGFAIEDLKAKHRLALAMTGQNIGDRVTQSVRLSDQTMSAEDFERMVTNLVTERSSNVGVRTVAEGSRYGPPPGAMHLSEGVAISDASASNRVGRVAWALDDRHLAIHSQEHISLLDHKGTTLMWQKGAKPSSSPLTNSTFAPLLLSDSVVFAYRSGGPVELACFDLTDGTERWRQSLDAGVASDPLLIGSWIYVVSIEKAGVDGYVALVMHRLSPRTGESVLAKRILELRTVDNVPVTVGRPQQVNGTLLVRTAGAIVCCDLMGNTRWVRELPFIPPTADAELTDGRPPMAMSVTGQLVLVTSVGSPLLSCLNVMTGELLWARSMPDAQNIVGVTGDHFVVAFPQRIVAIQDATGEVTWSQSTAADPQSILIAEDGSVLTVTLDPIDGKEKRPPLIPERTIRWRAAKTGQVVRSVAWELDAADLFDSHRLISNGRSVLGLAHLKGNTKQMKLFLIESK